jgi:hypothetical protein
MKNPELIKFGDTIINLANITTVEREPNKVSVGITVPGGTGGASAQSALTLRFIGEQEREFTGIEAERLWVKLSSLAETVTVPPVADKES